MQASDSSDTLSMLRESAADFVRGSTDFKRLRERRGTLPGYDPSLARQMHYRRSHHMRREHLHVRGRG